MPRVAPARLRDLTPGEAAFVGVLALGNGGKIPNVFATIARNRRLFRAWLRFAATVLLGRLPRRDAELLVSRTAWNSGSNYEWAHHARLARVVGLDRAAIERIAAGPDAIGLSAWDAAMLRAADELHVDQLIRDATWAALSERYGDRQLIELCFLVGHYQMLAMTLNSLGVQHEHTRPADPAREDV
ncbi:MAG: carboxymuconolactone decarboxylase family protein [Acidimicrobiales bacterium]